MQNKNRTILFEKLKESLVSVLPITVIVFVLCFLVVPVSNSMLLSFVIGSAMLVIGMGLFTLGTSAAMTPMGEYLGSSMTRSAKLWLVILVGLFGGIIITVSEPDLRVLADQIPGIPGWVTILAVSVGVGVFLVVALLRILLKVKLSYLLIGTYALIFIMAFFVPNDFLALAFDAGGVTTGPMTVPFIMALGVGVAASRSDKNAENDSFGLVAVCSCGPIIATLALGVIYDPENLHYIPEEIKVAADSKELAGMFAEAFPEYIVDVMSAVLPIVVFFGVYNIFMLKLKKETIAKLGIGLTYTFIGLVLFLTGVGVGFMPMGHYLGSALGESFAPWMIAVLGVLVGYFIIKAEPAVYVLNKQVEEITSGAIPQKAMGISLSLGVAGAVGLALLRASLGFEIWYLIVPGYLIAILLTFFSPPIFTAIAFDSGGVASGPMTASFLLPFATGITVAVGGNPVTDAFGVVSMVAMVPLISIQILGVIYKLRSRRDEKKTKSASEDIIEF